LCKLINQCPKLIVDCPISWNKVASDHNSNGS